MSALYAWILRHPYAAAISPAVCVGGAMALAYAGWWVATIGAVVLFVVTGMFLYLAVGSAADPGPTGQVRPVQPEDATSTTSLRARVLRILHDQPLPLQREDPDFREAVELASGHYVGFLSMTLSTPFQARNVLTLIIEQTEHRIREGGATQARIEAVALEKFLQSWKSTPVALSDDYPDVRHG